MLYGIKQSFLGYIGILYSMYNATANNRFLEIVNKTMRTQLYNKTRYAICESS